MKQTENICLRTKTINAIPLIAIAAVCLAYLIYVLHYGVDVLYWDSWDGLNQVTKFYFSNHHDFKYLWNQHGESRILVSNILDIAWIVLFHYNTKLILLVQALVAFALLSVVIVGAKKMNVKCIYIPLLALIVLNLGQYQNILWSFQLAWFLVDICLIITILLLNNPQKNWLSFAAAVAFAILGSLTFINGFLIWPVGLISQLHSIKRKRILIWIASAIATTSIYFYSYHSQTNFHSVFGHAWSIVYVFVAVNAAAIVPINFIANYIAIVILGILWITIQCLILYRCLIPEKNDAINKYFTASLIIFSLLFSGIVAMGRSTQLGIPSRYSTATMMALVGAFIYLVTTKSLTKTNSRDGIQDVRILKYSVSFCIFLWIVLGNIGGLIQGPLISHERIIGGYALARFINHPDLDNELYVRNYIYPHDLPRIRKEALFFISKGLKIDTYI